MQTGVGRVGKKELEVVLSSSIFFVVFLNNGFNDIANGVVVGNHERFEAIREDRADCFLSDEVDRFGFKATLEGLFGW